MLFLENKLNSMCAHITSFIFEYWLMENLYAASFNRGMISAMPSTPELLQIEVNRQEKRSHLDQFKNI